MTAMYSDNILKIYILLIFIVLFLSGCSEGEEKNAVLGPYQMVMVSDPSPPKVGFDASFKVSLEDEGRVLPKACRPRFRHYMPGMAMSHDEDYVLMTDGKRSGEFVGRSGQFSMGGDWVVEFVLNCQGDRYSHAFNYSLEWPE